MAEKTQKMSQLSPEQSDALAQIVAQGVVDPIEGLRALNLAPGKGEWADLQPPGFVDDLAHRFGFQTDTARRNNDLLTRQKLALPMIMDIIKAHGSTPTAEEALRTFPGFPITSDFYKPTVEPVETTQNLVPNTFDIDKLMPPAQSHPIETTRAVMPDTFDIDQLMPSPGGQSVQSTRALVPDTWDVEQLMPQGLSGFTPYQEFSTSTPIREAPGQDPRMVEFQPRQESPGQASRTIMAEIRPEGIGQQPRTIEAEGEPEFLPNKKLTPGLNEYYKALLHREGTQPRTPPQPHPLNTSDLTLRGINQAIEQLELDKGRKATPGEISNIYKDFLAIDAKNARGRAAELNAQSAAKLREHQGELVKAQTEYERGKAQLQRELKAMNPTEASVIGETIRRVNAKLAKGELPLPLEMAIVTRFLKGTNPIRADFMGRLYDSATGRRVDPTTGKPIEPEVEEGTVISDSIAKLHSLFNDLATGLSGLVGQGSTEQGTGPKIGTEKGGYRFKGGDPAKKENWEKVK